MSNFSHAEAAIWQPDEHGMAYVTLRQGGGVVRKTVQCQVNLDLNEQGEVIGIEIFNCPPIALIKGEK